MIFNVRDFGAVGDGATNDTAAIQAAVDAAHAAGGGQVYIPAGTYIVTGHSSASDGAIMLYDNITVYGDGMGASTVKLQDNWNHAVTGIFRTPADVENHDVGMHDLTIDGNRANNTGKVDGWFNGVSPGEPGADTNITLDHVEIMNCGGYGFDPHEETINLVITNCISHGNGIDGFTLDFQINGRVENCVAYENDRHGFNIVTSSHDILLLNNIAHDNGGDGIIVQRGSEDVPVPYNIIIRGGSVYNNHSDGVQVDKADYVTVDNVNVHHNWERGIRFLGSNHSIIQHCHVHNNSMSKNLAYEEIRLENYDDTAGASGRFYLTTHTQIIDNTITDDGAVRGNYSVKEMPGVDYTTISGNTIYGTGHDTPLLSGSHSTFTEPDPASFTPNTDPNAPHILYAPLLGQSNAELMKLTAPDGGSGLGHVESGLMATGQFDQVVTMTNIAVGGSTVDGDRGADNHPERVWWYPDQMKPGQALLEAVDQMQHQIAELRALGPVTINMIWGQGESEANQLGTPKSEAGRQLNEQEYINSTRQVFNYIQDHLGHDADIQFYLMETGIFHNEAAAKYGYPQFTIDKENLGLTYVHDAQEKMALAWADTHLAVNYSDLPMNADVDPNSPDYDPSWETDTWHLSLTSKEIAADRLTNFIALDMGTTHMLDDPGPNYPLADLADLTIHAGPGVTATGNTHNNIVVGTTASDNLSGGDGDDVLVSGGGHDVLNGGNGSDRFYYHPAMVAQIQAAESTTHDDSDTIIGFQTGAGGDKVDVSALLYFTGYTGSNPIGDGRVIITQVGSDTVISFDQDGTGGTHSAVAVAKLVGISTSQFDVANNLVTVFPKGNAVVVSSHASPWAYDDNFSSQIGQAVHGNVLVDNGLGADFSPDGDALSTVARTVTTAYGGTAVVNASGTFDYTPAVGFYGTDKFTYGLIDSEGGKDTGTVIINVALPAGALVGTTGDDILTGGTKADTILGLAGNDTLSGGSNNDVIYGGSGNDVINGNTGNDTLYAMSGNSTLNGNDDNDTLYAGSGVTILNGGNGNDTFYQGTGSATMAGGKGTDMYIFASLTAGATTITDFALASNDKIDVSKLLLGYNSGSGSITNYVRATAQGSDMILSIDADGAVNGTNFVNLVTLRNVTSFDVQALETSGNLITAGTTTSGNHPPVAAQDDFVTRQDLQVHGNLLLDNGHGFDTDSDGDALSLAPLTGQATAHGIVDVNADGTFLYTPTSGYSGADSFVYTLLDGHGGTAHGTVNITIAAALTGTAGDDTIVGGSRDDLIHGLAGNDTLSGGSGNDTIYGDEGNDSLSGNAGNDTLYAVSGNDILHGYDANDTLYAGTGIDQLYGDSGNDLLVAATGQTTMTGGGGGDTFRFTSASAPVDTITDFHSSVGDIIDISGVIPGYDPATQAIADWVHATSQGADTMLSIDADGAANGANFTNLVLVQGTHLDINALIASGNLLV